MPFSMHICPKRAACWSPAMPDTGIWHPKCSLTVNAYFSLLDAISGSIFLGMPKICSSSLSHDRSWILNRRVLLALLTSVTYLLPCVSLQTSQVSTVPNASLPFSACSLAEGTLSSIHFIFVAEKYGSSTSPVFLRIMGSIPWFLSWSQIPAVRRSCQTIALYTGLPVSLSHTSVVSRWLVMPLAITSLAVIFCLVITS